MDVKTSRKPVFKRFNTLHALVPRQKRRSWRFICQRVWLTVAVPDCAFKRVFENFCLLG